MNENRQLVKVDRDFIELNEQTERSLPPSAGYAGYGVDADAASGVRLLDYWLMVRKHLWLVIGVVVLGTALAAVYMARKANVYEAQARVQVDSENAGQLLDNNAPRNGSVVLNNRVNDPAYFNTQLQILTGPGILRGVVRALDLEHNQRFLRRQPTQTRSTWQSLRRMVGLDSSEEVNAANKERADEVPVTESMPITSREDLKEARRLEPFVRYLRTDLKVEPVRETRLTFRDTRLIDIRYTHSDPMLAARIVNSLVENFVRSNQERRTEANVSTGDFLQRRIAELQDRIRQGEERLINYAQRNEILSLEPTQNTVVERLVGLNRQLLEAENERALAEAAYRAAARPGAAEALVADATRENSVISEAENRLAELRQKRAQLLVENTEEWPEVKEINEQIAALEKQVRDTRSRATSDIVTNLETRYRQAAAREQALRATFNRQRGETLTQNEAAVNYRIIQQEIETNRELLNGLLQSSRENEVVRAETPNNIRIIDYAIAPDRPVGPKRVRNVLMAFIFSLGLGIGLALLLEYLDNTIRTTDDIERTLRLPTLALIPISEGAVRRRFLPALSALKSNNGASRSGKELLINVDARSALSEAYRQLRTSVLLSTAGSAPKTLLVTSSVPSEGKTTTVINMAVSLAQTGASVLVIDADMRRPRLHSVFELENRRGLSTILSNYTGEADVLAVIQRHETSGVNLMPSGPVPPNPAELLGSDQMERLIATLESSFTHIIIDSPPTASFTDSVLLSRIVDGVLLVVHAGRTSREVVKRSRRALQDVGARIIGVVLNNADLHKRDYYYYYHQHKYYGKDAEHLAPDAVVTADEK